MKRFFVHLRRYPSLHQLVKYMSVGGVNTVVIFSLFFLFNDLLHTNPIWANRFAYTGGLICNFTLNKLWTFRSRSFRPIEILLFLLSFSVSYGIQLLCFRILMDGLNWDERIAALLAYPLYGGAFYLQCRFVAFNRNIGRVRGAVIEMEKNREAG